MSPLALKRALAAPFAVTDDQFAVGKAALDAADVTPGVVAQHVAPLDIRFDAPDRAALTVADDTAGINLIAGIKERCGIALSGSRGDGGA